MTKVASHGLSLFWPSAGWDPEQPECWLLKLNHMGNYASLYVVSIHVEISRNITPLLNNDHVPNNCHQFPDWVT